MAVLNHFVLLLHCTPGLSCLVPYTPHAVDVHAETEYDKAKDDDEKCLGVLVGKVLHLGSELIQLAPPCESSACINIPFVLLLVCVLGFLLNVLIQERSPVGDEKAMRIVVRSRHPFQLSCRDKFSHEDACASLNTLTTIVGKLHVVLVELDAVTEDTEHGTCSHDVRIEAFFL